MRQWLGDTLTITGLCFKLLFHRRFFRILLLLLAGCFALLLGGLTERSEEQSSIPAAVVQEEESGEAAKLVSALTGLPALRVERMTGQESEKALKSGKVQAVFVVKAGYGEKLRQGRRKDLLTVRYREGEESSRILSDMAAGELLFDLCLRRSFLTYQDQDGEVKVDWDAYEKQAQGWLDTEESDFVFDYRYYGGTEEEQPENRLIYLQVILGMTAVFLMLLSFLLYAGSGERGKPERSGTGSISCRAALAGSALYQLAVTFAGGLFLLVVLLVKAEAMRPDRLLAGAGILFGFVLAESLIFLLLREITGSTERFLLVGGAVFCLLSVLALVRVANAFLPEWVRTLSAVLPGGRFILRMLPLL